MIFLSVDFVENVILQNARLLKIDHVIYNIAAYFMFECLLSPQMTNLILKSICFSSGICYPMRENFSCHLLSLVCDSAVDFTRRAWIACSFWVQLCLFSAQEFQNES